MTIIIRPPLGSFNHWNKTQLFGYAPYISDIQGCVIPNVGDKVSTFTGNFEEQQRVTAVGPSPEYKITLIDLKTNSNTSEDPIIASVGSANLGAVSILYVNPTETNYPSVFHVDMLFRGLEIAYGKLFVGVDLTTNGDVCSLTKDATGTIFSDRVTFLREDPADSTNLRYVASPFNLDRKLMEDKIVTLQLYNSRDVAIGYYTSVVKYNHALSNNNARELFVTDLVLESELLNPLVRTELIVPISFLNKSFNPRVYKLYNNGRREEILLSSPNLTISGWDSFLLGESGEQFPLVIKYKLSKGERADDVDMHNGLVKTKVYTVKIVETAETEDDKILPTVVYDRVNNAYKLEFYLYHTDYSSNRKITELVTLDPAFIPGDYVNKQDFNFTVDLRTDPVSPIPKVVDGSFSVALKGSPLVQAESFRYYPHVLDTDYYYGGENRIRCYNDLGSMRLNLTNAFTQKEDWIDKLFYHLSPPYETSIEDHAPVPEFLEILIGDTKTTLTIDTNWNGDIAFTGTLPTNGDSATLFWYLVDSSGVRRDLAVGSLPIEVI